MKQIDEFCDTIKDKLQSSEHEALDAFRDYAHELEARVAELEAKALAVPKSLFKRILERIAMIFWSA